MFLPQSKGPRFRPTGRNWKIIVLYSHIFRVLESLEDDKEFSKGIRSNSKISFSPNFIMDIISLF
jgi:hypothetical protein